MNRNEWIANFDESMHVKFNMAVDFFNRYGNRRSNSRGMIRKKYHKMDGTHVPTEGEYNLLVNCKQFQKHYSYLTSEPKFEIGDIITTKLRLPPSFDKTPTVAIITEREFSVYVGWTYSIQLMSKADNSSSWPNTDNLSGIMQKNILPIAGRNLNKMR